MSGVERIFLVLADETLDDATCPLFDQPPDYTMLVRQPRRGRVPLPAANCLWVPPPVGTRL